MVSFLIQAYPVILLKIKLCSGAEENERRRPEQVAYQYLNGNFLKKNARKSALLTPEFLQFSQNGCRQVLIIKIKNIVLLYNEIYRFLVQTLYLEKKNNR